MEATNKVLDSPRTQASLLGSLDLLSHRLKDRELKIYLLYLLKNILYN